MNKYKVRFLCNTEVRSELLEIGFCQNYVDKAINKYHFNLIKIHSLTPTQANILKQTALSKGGDLGVGRGVVNCSVPINDTILAATDKQIKAIAESLKLQHFGLPELGKYLEDLIKLKHSPPEPLKILNKTFKWGTKTHLMGILNITPDSFSDGGKNLHIDDAMKTVCQMINDNVDIIDIGAESTRPFSEEVDAVTQIKRALPIIKEIRKNYPELVLSIDTRNAKVAAISIEAGVNIVNDVSGLRYDSEMINVISSNNLPVIIMHSLSTPDKMQIEPKYNNLIDDISSFLIDSTELALNNNIPANNIIIDPGIGFGKTTEDNIQILKRIKEFNFLGYPLLVGISRKKFISNLIENIDINFRDEATLAINSYLISQNVDILRVHNTQKHSSITNMLDKIFKV